MGETEKDGGVRGEGLGGMGVYIFYICIFLFF